MKNKKKSKKEPQDDLVKGFEESLAELEQYQKELDDFIESYQKELDDFIETGITDDGGTES